MTLTQHQDAFLVKWAQNVLACERYYTHDKDYARNLSKLITHSSRRLGWPAGNLPLLSAVEAALHRACQSSSKSQPVWTKLLHQLFLQKQHPPSPDQLLLDLKSADWSKRFLARHVFLEIGGQAIETLTAILKEDAELVIRLVQNIELETKTRFAEKCSRLVCPDCLVHCQAHHVVSSWQSNISFHGCRACKQSRRFIHCPKGIIALLDATWEHYYKLQDETLTVNWSVHRAVFDFDRIHIVHATDEDVERFTVQIGNDTDTWRKNRYPHMECIINPSCTLSKNTLRILEKMFGRVSV